MNYLLLILVILLLLGALDLLPAPKYMHYGIWLIAFFSTATLCTIKYYYGVDMSNYFIDYTICPKLDRLLINRVNFPDLEFGFYAFSSLCKTLGLSFYQYTAVISLIFWTAVYCLFRKIETHRVFALLCLFILCKDLIFEQYRQSMAVASLIFAYLAYDKRRYLLAAAMLLLMVSFHKSGMAMVAIIMLGLVLQYIHLSYKWYYVLIVGMLLLMMLNFTSVVQVIYNHMDTSANASTQASSIVEHFTLARRVQVILPVYIMMMLAFAQREKRNDGRLGFVGAMVFIASGMIAILYPYYLMLGRLRSFMMPFIIIAVMQYLDREEPQISFRRRLCSMRIPCVVLAYVVMGYMANVLITRHPIPYDTSLLEVTPYNAQRLRDQKLQRAHYYWNFEYDKQQSNDVNARKN